MPSTFPQFAFLPSKLREHIWKLAIRPSCRRVYHISIYDGAEGEDSEDDESPPWKSQSWYMHEVDTDLAYGQGDTAAEKLYANAPPARWTTLAPSTNDSLWAVNKETRHIAESVSKGGRWDAVDLQLEFSTDTAHGDSKCRTLTIFPQQDLFYLQPKCLQALPWERLDLSSPLHVSSPGFDRLHNVALGFESAWAIEMIKAERRGYNEIVNLDIVQTFVKAAFSASQDTKLWFVDYHIKRKHHVPTKQQISSPASQVFYTGNRRFVEVAFDYYNPHDNPWERYFDEDDDSFCDCIHFIQELEVIIDGRYFDEVDAIIFEEDLVGVYGSMDGTIAALVAFGLIRPPPRLSFGVLACECY